jgi:CheY-like chemotaxis protein
LGLAIVEQLVSLMHGTVSVESEPDKGAKFTCELFVPVTDEVTGETRTTNDDATKLLIPKKYTLLVIDDNVVNLKTISTLLTHAGYKCLLAENGEQAKNLFKSSPVDLILTDIQLPDIHGFELIKFFRQQNTEIPIVAYSAFAFDEDVAAAINIGATDYLRKPAMFGEIKAKLNEYL